MRTPGLGAAIEKVVAGLVALANDAAQWSVRPDAVYAEYREHGFPAVKGPADLLELDLEDVDKRIGWLNTKYKGVTFAEGAALGAAGLPGIPFDIVSLVTLNLRAIGEYATYCGFDIESQHERLYAMHILGLASSPTDNSKAVAMAQLVKIAKDVAARRTWKDLEKHAFVQLMKQIAKALGIRLTKAKLAQIVPLAGAVVGGGFNSYFTAKICDCAYHLYRERFLAAKYGEDFIASD
jgi:hypothetical protein